MVPWRTFQAVDGRYPAKTTTWDGAKTLVKNGTNYQLPTSTGCLGFLNHQQYLPYKHTVG